MIHRKDGLVTEKYYHICSKSIAGYIIFNQDDEYRRILALIRYYQIKDIPTKFSSFIEGIDIKDFNKKFVSFYDGKEKLVKIIAFCFMPTHIHLVLQQKIDGGISRFMSNILNSYARYFNVAHKRKGPLWQGRFKSILVKRDSQLLHLSRYVHLNPASESMVDNPEQWPYSSYQEYLGVSTNNLISEHNDVLNISPGDYRRFVENRIAYQRELSEIKHLILE